MVYVGLLLNRAKRTYAFALFRLDAWTLVKDARGRTCAAERVRSFRILRRPKAVLRFNRMIAVQGNWPDV